MNQGAQSGTIILRLLFVSALCACGAQGPADRDAGWDPQGEPHSDASVTPGRPDLSGGGCVPRCSGKSCGPDGCGGSCGACRSGQSCSNGQCQCQPQCNGRSCGADGCGGSCGLLGGACTDGSACNSNGSCEYTGLSQLSWTVINRCPAVVQYRFFDEARGWVWPNANQVWVLQPGASATQVLTCHIGDNICFGARRPSDGGYWGVDIDDSKPCASCCFHCATQSVALPPLGC